MTKKQTINQQIESMQALIIDGDLRAAADLRDKLLQRRLTDAQRDEIGNAWSEIDEEESVYSMSQHLQKYRARYQLSIAHGGGKSLSNGDDLAQFLEGRDWREVCKLADEALNEDAGFHAAKYEHLNIGQRRMNAGNRLRALWKRGEWTIPAH